MTGLVLDNQDNRVVDYIIQHLSNADSFRVVSAYFTIHGYDLLSDRLDSVSDVRFLFGDPDSLDELDPSKKEEKRFEIREGGLHPMYTLNQKPLATQCHNWMSKPSVLIRSMDQSNFLHGKMYLMESQDGVASVVGSSNFTRRGLGDSDIPNIEINLTNNDRETAAQLREWFDRLWNDTDKTRDVKREVLDVLQRIGRDYSPEVIYYKTLYELFKKEIEERKTEDNSHRSATLKDSQIWNKLYAFQQDGVNAIISKLQKYNGCILADSVGLGKTYTALAVVKYFEQRNERVLVLCPRKLKDNWSLYQAGNNHVQNPFPDDRFAYTLLSHTDLSREYGNVGGIDLANFNWSNYDLVVIDESHNFRKNKGSRYNKLLEDIFKTGVNTKVLMLSATPVNTSLLDLRNQILLMGDDGHFRKSLGISNVSNTVSVAQKAFKEWESSSNKTGNRNKAELLENINSDFFRLLNAVSISRSRRHVRRFYADEMLRVGEFPAREKPHNQSPKTDLNGELSYEELAENINDFKLSLYKPSHYLINVDRLHEDDPKRKNITQWHSEEFLVGMMRTNFLKRLESSAHSLKLTLERTIEKIDAILDKIRQGSDISNVDVLPDNDKDGDDGEMFINSDHVSYRLYELDLNAWKKDLRHDRRLLSDVLRMVSNITPERDGKLKAVKQDIHNKVTSPTYDKDGKPNRKILMFTTFKDTAKYLYNELEELSRELGINMAMVSGVENLTQLGRNGFNDILANFAPVANNHADTKGEIDLLIATDCISEGQNLQDCDTVLNYDIHWNPVRLIQRFGRIDRIGSRSRTVKMVNYWPTDDMEVYLRLKNRVQSRMVIADITATGDYDPLEDLGSDGEAYHNFRDDQLRRLMEEIIDLDDEQSNVGLGDFIIEDFFAQLIKYLEKNKELLEGMPSGVYGVADWKREAPLGVIFFLRQRNADSDWRQQPASPVHPFYLVYLYMDGSIRHGCSNTKQILNVFQAASVGKTLPIQELCDKFDRETEYGKNMEVYNRLLNFAITQIKQANRRRQSRNLGTGGFADFVVQKISKSPRTASDFELVTWLVIMPGGVNNG